MDKWDVVVLITFLATMALMLVGEFWVGLALLTGLVLGMIAAEGQAQ